MMMLDAPRRHASSPARQLAVAAVAALLAAAGCGETVQPRGDTTGDDLGSLAADPGAADAPVADGPPAESPAAADGAADTGLAVEAGASVDAGNADAEPAADAGLAPAPLPPATFGAISPAGLAVVMSKPLAKVKNSDYPASKFAFSALGLTVLALEAYRGNTSVDTKLLAEIRGFIHPVYGANCAGGYDIQLQVPQAAMVLIASRVPRIWSQLTAGEKTKVALVFKAQLVKAAMPSSDHNVQFVAQGSKGVIKSMGGQTYWPRGNPNFSTSGPAMVQLAAFYLGASKAKSFLDGFDHAAFTKQLNQAGLTSAGLVFNTIPAGAPTAAAVETAVHNWTGFGLKITDAVALFKLMAERTFSKKVTAGLNSGAGVSGTAGCGAILSGAAGLPNKGKLGMAHEFESVDAEGKRACADYSYDGIRTILVWAAAGLVTGDLPASSPQVKALFDSANGRIHIGITDHRYKTDHGFRNYNHGKCKGDFTWAHDGERLVLEASYSLYFDALEPHVAAAP